MGKQRRMRKKNRIRKNLKTKDINISKFVSYFCSIWRYPFIDLLPNTEETSFLSLFLKTVIIKHAE